MNTTFEELEERANRQVEDFKIENVIATKDFVLVSGRIQCPVYFAFYKHFIVCSGDYGEWQFDCTWDTVQGNKPIIPESEYYLKSKVSHDNKHTEFDSYLCEQELKEWFNELKKDYKPSDDEIINMDLDYDLEDCYLIKEDLREDYTNDDLQELIDDFDAEDEYRCGAKFDELMSDFNNIAYYEMDWEDVGHMGNIINIQFLINLKMLQKVREYFEKLEEQNGTKGTNN